MVQLGIGEQFTIIGGLSYVIFKFLPFYTAIAVILGALLAYLASLYYEKSYFERVGIPGRKPNLLLGNTFHLAGGIHKYDMELAEKYETFGSYIFGGIDIASTDFNILRRVLVKDFSHFVDRPNPLKLNRDGSEDLSGNSLTAKQGDDWKRIRNLITPAFTTGKMKKLVPIFNKCSKELGAYLESFCEEPKDIPLKDTMEKLTMTVIARAAFSLNVNAFKSEQSEFMEEAKKIFQVNFMDPGILFMVAFPNVAIAIKEYTGYSLFLNKTNNYFKEMLGNIYDQRRADKDAAEKYQDFFQLLLNALDEGQENHKEENDGNSNGEDADIIHKVMEEGSGKYKKSISRIEILAQSFVVLLAGYETTATTLHLILYNLAKYPEVQERLRDEVNSILEDREDIEYDDIAKFQYMNQVIYETMRLYPPATRANRVCTQPINISGIDFQKEFMFSIPIFAIHHDPKIYPNPYEFNPDRFSPEEKAKRDPLSFLPFGYGPRNCIGMRFAEFEIRATLAYLVKNFRFYPTANTPEPPLDLDTRGLLKPKEVLYVRAEKL